MWYWPATDIIADWILFWDMATATFGANINVAKPTLALGGPVRDGYVTVFALKPWISLCLKMISLCLKMESSVWMVTHVILFLWKFMYSCVLHCIFILQFYGPRNGALYIRQLGSETGAPLYPLFFGGGQERNYRPGLVIFGMTLFSLVLGFFTVLPPVWSFG